MITEYDVGIIGGGMVGASLACGLARHNINIALIEKSDNTPAQQPGYDDRGIALSLSSQRILASMGLWSKLHEQASPIDAVHVSEKGRCRFLRISAEQCHLRSLGFVLIARELGRTLLNELASFDNIDLIRPASAIAFHSGEDKIEISVRRSGKIGSIACKLLVIADGASSTSRELLGVKVRRHDYRQTAIVCNITASRGQARTAYERFTPYGLIALLPLARHRYVSVFVVATDSADACLEMDDGEYIRALQTRLGRRLGDLHRPGTRKPYPLFLCEPERQVSHRAVLLGNAAHTIHPNGAQGFNLALRDVATLTASITRAMASGDDPGGKELLQTYLSRRQVDQRRVIRFTDALANVFHHTHPVKSLARGSLMFLIDAVPELKRQFVSRATGIYRDQVLL